MTFRASVELEMPFHDVDAARIAWHGHYYKYFEIGRTALVRAYDLDVYDMLDIGVAMVVGETRCRYHHPLRYGDKFVVHSWFGVIEPYIRVHYEIDNLTAGRRSARGSTTLITVTTDGFERVPPPAALLGRILAGPVDREA